MSAPLLQVSDLSVAAGGRMLLRHVAFEVRRGQTFALLGESGSGKSMTALALMRLLPAGVSFRSGSVRFDQYDLLRMPAFAMRCIRGRRLAMIFQEPMTSLNPVMTAGAQLLESLRMHRGLSGKAAERRALETLEKVGLDDPRWVLGAYPHELSGGMKQRVMIATAIAGEPELLIADEPTTALDVTIQAQVLELLKSLQTRLGMAMLFVSHDLSIVSNIADRIAVIRRGRVVDETDTTRFFTGQRHPYSRHLLQVVPSVEKRGAPLSGLANQGSDERRNPAFGHPPPFSGSAKLLEINALKVHFPIRSGVLRRVRACVKAVDGVSLSLGVGSTLALVGESGCGKTTLAKAILGLVPVTHGSIRFDGRQCESLRGGELRSFRRAVQVVFQDPFSSMNPKMPVREIVKEGLWTDAAVRNERRADRRVAELLTLVGIDPAAMRRYPHEFSGGQRQRICIARALAVRPKLLICDEPTSALDVSVQAQILDLFRRLQQELGLSYLFITHDISVVSYMAHMIAVMHDGRIVENGEAVTLLNSPCHDYTRALLASVPVIRVA